MCWVREADIRVPTKCFPHEARRQTEPPHGDRNPNAVLRVGRGRRVPPGVAEMFPSLTAAQVMWLNTLFKLIKPHLVSVYCVNFHSSDVNFSGISEICTPQGLNCQWGFLSLAWPQCIFKNDSSGTVEAGDGHGGHRSSSLGFLPDKLTQYSPWYEACT